eukprot:scaffold340763_cov189-Cyclotella_meneghiniana.AAC.2
MVSKNVPSPIWDYALIHHRRKELTGCTPDILEYSLTSTFGIWSGTTAGCPSEHLLQRQTARAIWAICWGFTLHYAEVIRVIGLFLFLAFQSLKLRFNMSPTR